MLTIEVNAPAAAAGQSLVLKVGSTSLYVTLDTAGHGTVRVPAPPNARDHVDLRLTVPGFDVRTASVDLNGSGHISWLIDGALEQWPAITWQAVAGPLDVTVDDRPVATTPSTRGVRPGEHTFRWLRNTGMVCVAKVTLQANFEKTFVCDPSSGSVSSP